MKRTVIMALVLITSLNSIAQDQHWSATAAFPLATGDFGYAGIADVGLQYRFIKVGPVALGGSAAVDFLKENDQGTLINISRNAFLVIPRIFGELQLPGLKKLKPHIGVGYAWANFKNEVGITSSNLNENGFNFNLGVAYDLTDLFFVQLQFDTTSIKEEVVIQNINQFRFETIDVRYSVDLFKIGIGLRF